MSRRVKGAFNFPTIKVYKDPADMRDGTLGKIEALKIANNIPDHPELLDTVELDVHPAAWKKLFRKSFDMPGDLSVYKIHTTTEEEAELMAELLNTASQKLSNVHSEINRVEGGYQVIYAVESNLAFINGLEKLTKTLSASRDR